MNNKSQLALVFYLIKDGDWNIQDPLSRFLQGRICEFGNSAHFYGEFHDGFKNFLIEWLSEYSNVNGDYNIRNDKDLFNKTVGELDKIIRDHYGHEDEQAFLIRGLVINKRFDVIYNLFLDTKPGFDENGNANTDKIFNERYIDHVTDLLLNVFGVKIFKILPQNITEPILSKNKKSLNRKLLEIKDLYDIIYLPFEKTSKAKHSIGLDNDMKIMVKQHVFKNLNNFIMNYNNVLGNYGAIRLSDFDKITDIEIYNEIKRYNSYLSKIGRDKIQEKLKEYYYKIIEILK